MDSRIYALTMPKWGLSMKKGQIASWLVDLGSAVGPGIEVVDIETEKVTSGLEPSQAGILRHKTAAAGAEVPVGGLIGIVAEPSVMIRKSKASLRSLAHILLQSPNRKKPPDRCRNRLGRRVDPALPCAWRRRRTGHSAARLRG